MNIADEYLQAKVMTAPQEELHLMVVDGALRQAALAERALREENFASSHAALSRAREFVIELITGMDQNRSPELVTQLKGLFGFAYRRLNEADLHRDLKKLEEAMQVLRSHRETWRELIRTRVGKEGC